MYLEEEKNTSFALNEVQTISVNQQHSIKAEVLAAVSAEERADIKQPDVTDGEHKEQNQVIAPDGSVVPIEGAAEGEKTTEEKKSIEELKSTEEPKPSDEHNAVVAPENAQSEGDSHMLALTKEPNAGDLREGHSEDLMYIWYGLPPGVDSTPRDFGIGPFPPSEQKLYLPTIEHPIQTSNEGPCCVLNVPIFLEQGEISTEAVNSQDSLSLSGHTYTFTFEGFCNDNIPSDLIFTDTVSFSGSNASTQTLTIPIESCFDQVDCDNPITSIVLNTGSSSAFFESGINLFVDFATAYDSHNNPYFFIDSPNGQITLEALSCLESSSPIVLDLNNNGLELSNVRDSNILLSVDGNSVKTGWVGPHDGFLTYGYSGEGAIENKNFILTDNVPGAKTDLQALESLAGKSGGILDSNNAIWDKLGVWQDSNQNGKMDNGEYHKLSDLGITSIDLNGTDTLAKNLNGNVVNSIISFTYADGSVGKGADVSLRYEDVIQSNTGSIPNLGGQTGAPSAVATTATQEPATAPATPVVQDAAVHSAVEAVVQQQVVHQA